METFQYQWWYCNLVSTLIDVTGTFGIPQGKRDETKEKGGENG
jgi:hypothetical protein